MKKIEKKIIRNIFGGNVSCYVSDLNRTICQYYGSNGQYCIGEYTWSGNVKQLHCN
jgi:hypothetical protein